MTKNTVLAYLECDYNQLRSLDMTRNTALTELCCQLNRLTAEGLKALFGTLHSNAGFNSIYIGGNPGANDCDRTIATKKGWKFG